VEFHSRFFYRRMSGTSICEIVRSRKGKYYLRAQSFVIVFGQTLGKQISNEFSQRHASVRAPKADENGHGHDAKGFQNWVFSNDRSLAKELISNVAV
jgi:hypothetical protein